MNPNAPPPPESALAVVLVTAGSEAEAETLAHQLLEQRLAACVSVFAVRSHYRWQGAIQHQPEWQLLIKTDRAQVEALTQAIVQHHSYDLPEVLALPIVAGLPDYLAWLRTEVSSP
jgi:periplasmic divalent cation tolerance protein